VVRDVQQVQILPHPVLQPECGENDINQLINEGQVDLEEGGGHQGVREVQQVQILPRLGLRPEQREWH
jgi:hypothetical protein